MARCMFIDKSLHLLSIKTIEMSLRMMTVHVLAISDMEVTVVWYLVDAYKVYE